ncbi:MAG: hypothetical protein K0Q81_2166, partial [Paenibacillus sp.]|nr:hypothetical protein [Paenibacillus sp.]
RKHRKKNNLAVGQVLLGEFIWRAGGHEDGLRLLF